MILRRRSDLANAALWYVVALCVFAVTLVLPYMIKELGMWRIVKHLPGQAWAPIVLMVTTLLVVIVTAVILCWRISLAYRPRSPSDPPKSRPIFLLVLVCGVTLLAVMAWGAGMLIYFGMNVAG
jgi:hypothetical protein